MKGKIQVSKNNAKMVQQKMADQKQRFGIRKLSIGVASVLLGTLFYMQSGTVYADVNPTASAGNDGINVVNENSSTSSSVVGSSTSNSASSSSSVSSAGDATNSIDTHQVSASPVESATGQANNNAVAAVREQGSSVPTSHVNAGDDKTVKNENSNLDYHPTQVPNSHVALEKSVAGSGSVDSRAATPFQQVLAMKAETETPVAKPAVDSEAPKRETVDSAWTLHYVNQADHKQELKDPTVITMQYERTNVPQSDGKTQYGDWSYVPGSFKQTGTPIAVKDSDNPVKQDNVDKNGENMDVFTITAMYPTVAGYNFHDGINGTRLHDDLINDDRQADSMSKDFYAEYDVAKPIHETVTSQWTIHYVNSADHKQELKAPTVITQQYTRTDTPQSNGKIQYGDWSYVPGSFKQTGTLVEVNGSDNPVKEDNVDNNGKNEDVFSIIVKHPNITGYELHNGINGVRLSDYLLNNESNGEIQAPTMSKDGYVEYDVAKERSVAVKFVDDESFDPDSSDGKTQVGQALTLTGHDGDTVNLNLTVPDKYQLADGQQLPTTYTFTKGSGDLKIHLVHKVVQREATIDVQLGLVTFVDFGNKGYEPAVVTQARWAQLEEEAKNGDGPVSPDGVIPFTEVGTLTGHVGYDLVDEEAVSFGDDWTSLNLGDKTYQMPNGTEVVNGIMVDSDDTMGKKLKEEVLNEYLMVNPDKPLDPDYVNRPWHGYLSVNATNSTQTPGAEGIIRLGLQAGLAGNESNILAKATGDRAATAVEPVNKTIDVSWLQDNLGFSARGFKEQDGQLQAKTGWEAFGVYIPYVEKTATRTINVTTPDGKTTTVEQTATLAKQIDFGEDAHPAWTTGEWASYDVPTIPGYTASQSNVAKETVTGETNDQTVNITYTANPQTTTVVYQTEDGTPVHTTTVNGKTGQTVTVPNEVPTGWHLVNGSVPSEITFGPNGTPQTVVTIDHSHVTVTPDTPKTTDDTLPDNPGKTYPTGVGENDLNKTITRTIKVTTPDGQTKTIAQTAKLTRTADVDEVTGEVKYSDWTNGEWNEYDVPSVPGYTASQNEVPATEVTSDVTDQTVDISYIANSQTIHINYVDSTGKIVHTTTVAGKTGETVNVPNEVPAGWMITKGEVPSEISFSPNGHADETITIAHQHVTVDPDHPQTNSTKLPDNPAKAFNGVEANDLNKIITRTIKVTTPDGKSTTTKQIVKLTRTADVDEVTGEVTYGNWTTGQWDAYEVPALKGYIASQTNVEATPVDENTKDQTVEVSYTPNKQSTTIKYVDDKGQTIHTTTVNGVTNQTVKVPNEVPTGWTITKGEVPSEITFGADGHESVVITVVHQHVTVDPDHPQNNGAKLPDNPAKTFEGVEANDLNKIITRTIKVTTPNGKTTTAKQTAKLTRTADVDEVTGEVTYGNWTTGEWPAYNAPSVAGYTPSQTAVAKESVTATSNDTTVEITYQPMQHQISVEYVDDDDHGKVVKTDQVPGKTDQTITVTPSAPANYDLVDNGSRTYTVTSDDAQVVQIHVKHHQVTTSESKTVTRTVNVHTPRDGVKTVKQTVDLTRDVTTDQVTGEKTYSDWTTGQWKAYTPEAIPGYTLSTNEVPTANVDGRSTDQTVDVTYTANAQHVDVVYVDDTKGDSVVKTDQIAGKTDETIKVTPNVPTGYKVVGEVPGSYTMTADGHQTITVRLVHQMKTASESKAVTRTINVYTPHAGTTVFKQTVDLSRDVTTDQVTGDKTYGDWSTTEWTHYDIPVVAGYTPSIKQVAQQVVDGTTKDQTINVTYTANDQTTHVNYVDGDGNVVHTTTVTGKTDQTVKVPNETPASWKVVGESVPTEITFGPDGHTDVAVTVDHQHVTVTPDQPKTPADKLPNNPGKTYPNGVGHDDLNRIVTRTIKVVTPDDQTKTVTQKVQLTRTADVDEVTGEVTYGKWTTGEWTHYEVPAVPGYTPSQNEVPAVNVTDTTKDQMLTLTYTANDQTTHVNYVDGDGKTVHSTTIIGKTDQTVKVPNEVPSGWTITDGQVPAEITFGADGHVDVTVTVGHQHVTVTPDQPKTPSDKLPNNPGKTYPSGVGQDDLNKTVTRTVKVTTPDGKTQTTEQKVQLTRTADVDEVTGKVTYDKWTTGEWANYNVPTVTGYTASQSNVSATKVTSDTKNQTVTVTYTADAQTTTIRYVDQNGKVVHTTVVNGHTDQTIKVPNETPAGWTITNGQVPTEITFGPNGHDRVTITVDHKHVAVTPNKPQTDGTKLSDNPSQTFHGVGHNDLNKTIVRTIEVTAPTGKTDTVKQTAKLTRSADVDEVTGEVTYGKWTTGVWSSYNVPTVTGYTPSQAVVAEVTVNADMTDQTVKIMYTADAQTTHINYVDGNGNVVHTTTVNGHTDQTVKVPNETPAGWTITDGQVPSEVTFGADGTPDVKITVDHKTVTVAPDDPPTDGTKLPDNPSLTFQGVEHDDLNRTVTRTIKVTTPDGKTQTVAQKVQLTRSADVDEVTGEVTYGDWSTGAWEAYQAPTVPGYTASQVTVPATKVTAETADHTVAITYTANDQTTHINYVDDNGKIVRTTTITGKTDQTVKAPNEVPTGWTITNGQVPSDVIFGANGYDDVTVTVGHQHVTVTPDKAKTNGTRLPDNSSKTFHGVAETDLNKVVTRTIEVVSPAQKTPTVKQTAKLTRTADVDEVTGKVTYGKWTTGSWSSYTVPTIAGYTPSHAVVTEVAVDANTADQTVKITYTADSHTTHINYVDKNGNVVHTTTVTGATDQTVKVPNEVPADWKVTSESVPTELTFGPDGHADVTVTVDHLHVTVTPDQPRENDTKLPNTISKSTQSTQTASQNISIRTSQTSTPQTTNDVHESQLPQATNDDHESQLPQTGNKSDSKLELIGLIGIAFAGLFGFGTRRKKRD